MNDFQHLFDSDGVCIHCNFDGAEWHHWKHNTYEGRAATNTKMPPCEHQGLPTKQRLNQNDDSML